MSSALRPLLVYVAAAVAATWPLAVHPTSLLGAPVGPGDPYLNLWILGWGMQAAIGDPASVVTGRVFDANIFHPAPGTLAYSDHLLLQSVVLAPLYALTGNVVLCYNVLLLASLVGSALAMHAFVRSVVGSTGGAYLAGLAWGFGSYRFAHLLHLQLQSLYFLPLTFLFLHRVMAGRRRRDALVLGTLAALQAVSSVYYGVIGVVGLAAAAVPLAVGTGRRRLIVLARRLALAALVATALVAPVALVYWRVQQREGFGRNLYEAGQNAAYADSYFQVPPGNLLYGRTGLLRRSGIERPASPPHSGPERELFPGFLFVSIAAAGLWLGWRGDTRPLVVSLGMVVAAGFFLSLGPDGIRSIYAVLHRYIFGFQAIRAPARFGVLAMFGLCGLAAVGWRELTAGSHRAAPRHLPRLASAAVFVVCVLEWAHLPTALADAPPLRTEVGEWLRQQGGAGAIVELPIGIDIDNTPAMLRSLEHRRPLVNGYSGQRPAFYPSLVDALSTFPSDESLAVLHDSAVRFVVVHGAAAADAENAPPPIGERVRFADAAIFELQWTPEAEERLAHVSTVRPDPPGAIPFGPGETARYSVAWGGAGMNLAAGEIVVRVEPPAYRLIVEAATAPWMSRFFEAQDRFVTVTDQQLLTLVHEREQNEGSRHVTRAFVFDHSSGRVRLGRTLTDARGEEAQLLPLAPDARDSIAALFYVRTLPLEAGKRYQLPVNEAGRSVAVEVTARGRETITVNARATDALRIEPQLYQRVERRQPVRAVLWLSTDARRVPVALEVDAGFGHVRAELISYQGR